MLRGIITRATPTRTRASGTPARATASFDVQTATGDVGGPASFDPAAGPASLLILNVGAVGEHALGRQDGGGQRDTAHQHSAGIKALGDLQLTLLRGSDFPATQMEALLEIAAALEMDSSEAAGPGRAIALRIRVELAKREVLSPG